MPPALVGPALAVRRHIDGYPAVTVQPALADFITEGHFAAHLRRTRATYAARQEHLLTIAEAHWQPHLRVARRAGGVHLIGRLGRRRRDQAVATAAAKAGVIARPLSAFHHAAHRRHDGLILGYAGYPKAALTAAAKTLATVLRQPV